MVFSNLINCRYLRLSNCRKECVWDHAAGVAVVENAGGRVTDALGKSLDFRHGRRLEKNSGVIATNGKLHDQVTAVTAKLWSEEKETSGQQEQQADDTQQLPICK